MSRQALASFLRDLGVLFAARRLYPAANEQVRRAVGRVGASLAAWGRPVRIALLGDEAVVEGETLADPPSSLRAFFKALRATGCESALVEAGAGADTLAAWVEHVLQGRPEAFQAEGVATGRLELRDAKAVSPEAVDLAVEYVAMLPRVEDALHDIAAQRQEGFRQAREIVEAVATRLVLGEDLLRPVRELKGHDDYTFTHALNVCCLAAAIARALGASRELLDVISLAGLCHDVGKQLVPLEILNWSGPLDAESRRVMDAHPVHGARVLLAASGTVAPLVPVVAYQHHMAVDRSGYPCLPVGGPPHPASLLVSVADVFDAMRTVRPYRGARSMAEAGTVLLQQVQRGKLYERHVAALLGILGALAPGRAVRLSDGAAATIVEARPNPLRPVVEVEGGAVLDLSLPGAVQVAELLEVPE